MADPTDPETLLRFFDTTTKILAWAGGLLSAGFGAAWALSSLIHTKSRESFEGKLADTPREEMRRQIRSEIDASMERIDVKLREDDFALFLEAKTGDPEIRGIGLTNHLETFVAPASKTFMLALILVSARFYRAV